MSMLSEQAKELREMGKRQRNNAKVSEKVFLEIEKAFLQAADTIEALSAKLAAANRELAEYKDLERQGNLIRLPCKMGDTVYMIYNHSKNRRIIEEIKIDMFFLMQAVMEGRFGKTMFLTEEEAKEALKGK